jgi:redox-sensitive bicupin YhaK (pirin superfamily)
MTEEIMHTRTVLKRVPATAVSEGAGVLVHRSLGTPALRHLDPFLMLDHFASNNPDDYIAGFPDHPHRGFVTLTYMLDGHMEHRDSMGNRGDLRAGGFQWMKAASGVIHSEMPRQVDGLMRGFQLWINLPSAQKMSDPAYLEVPAEGIPELKHGDAEVRLISGSLGGAQGPIDDPYTELLYLDVRLPAGGRADLPLPSGHAAFLYTFEGQTEVAGEPVETHQLVLLGEGEVLEIGAVDGPARFILVGGRPLREPIVQHGPFVMTTREEIEQAMRDYRDGRLVRTAARVTGSAATP